MSDLEHGFGNALEGFHQRIANLCLQARQAQAEQHREEDDRQHLATHQRCEDVRRNQVEDGLDERVFMLNLGRSGLILGNIDGTQGTHVDTGTRMEQVGQHQADHDRDGGDHLEVNDGLEADTAEFFRIANPGDTHDQRRNHDRDDDHLDQANEDVTCRLQDVADPPCLFCTEMVQ
ncbi:hypothetical protein D3C80_668940 [compost metagenome]